MTEQQWLVCDDPLRMLGMHAGPGYEEWDTPRWLAGTSDRKLRLLSCGIGRVHPDLSCLDNHKVQTLAACDLAEQVADGEITLEEARDADNRSWIVFSADAADAARLMADHPRRTAPAAALVREVLGNPFRPVVLEVPCPQCGSRQTDGLRFPGLTGCGDCGFDGWNGGAIIPLAVAAYRERLKGCPCFHAGQPGKDCQRCGGTGRIGWLDPDRLGVLADALEDAGCTEEAVLSHLRSPAPHVRGGWALDLLLGKE